MTTPQGWAAPDDGAPAAPAPAGPAPAGQPQGGPLPPAAAGQGWQPAPGWGGPAAPAPQWGAPPAAGGWGPPPGPGGWSPAPPPDVKPGVVPLRPLGLGELLDGAVGVIRKYPRPTLGMAAVIALVTTLANIPLLLLASGFTVDPAAFEPGSSASVDAGDVAGAVGGGLLSLAVTGLAGVVLAGVITAVVGKAVLGQPMTLAAAWRTVRPLLLRLVGLAVLVQLAVYGIALVGLVVMLVLALAAGALTLLIGIPLLVAAVVVSIHLYARLALAGPVMVLERAGVVESMRRSGVLVRGDWWRVFGILLLVSVIALFMSAVLQTPFEARSFLSSLSGEVPETDGLQVVLSSIGQALALAVVGPFSAAVTALLYVDRRMRAEGLDVQLGAAAAAARQA